MSILIIAYAVVWLALFLYIARLHIEQRRLARGLEMLLQGKRGKGTGERGE